MVYKTQQIPSRRGLAARFKSYKGRYRGDRQVIRNCDRQAIFGPGKITGGIGMSRRLLLGNTIARGSFAAIAASALLGSAAFADELQEIVVTAQKRSENLQNVPIA